ncbi:MAG: hypothetical protein LLG06_00610 [Desulfobacteraceae bacterium]|nr:hypothetical protein [Desulfobacteraceae bacterium]
MKRPTKIIRRTIVALAAVSTLAAIPAGVSRAAEYSLKDFVILVDDQLIMKGIANIECCQGAAVSARGDIGSRNSIRLGGVGRTEVPDGAPVLQDVAVIAPNVTLNSFAAVSEVIYDNATGSYTVKGSGIVQPLAGNIHTDLGNNYLNDTGSKNLPDFPSFPSLIAGTDDIVVPSKGNVPIIPGTYRDLIIGSNATVNLSCGTYNFRRIIANTASRYQIVFEDCGTQINVKEFVRFAHYGSFNPTAKHDVTLYVGGYDGPYSGANKNKNGVARTIGTFPAAFEYDGAGEFHATLVYVKNGTINIGGPASTAFSTHWFGDSFQEVTGQAITLRHPGEICDCFSTATPCGCIESFSLNKTTGILKVCGRNLNRKTVGCLAAFSPTQACSIGGAICLDRYVFDLTFDEDGSCLTAYPDFAILASGIYYLGIVAPIAPDTENTPHVCVYTNYPLIIP